jgi:hypothetical protein
MAKLHFIHLYPSASLGLIIYGLERKHLHLPFMSLCSPGAYQLKALAEFASPVSAPMRIR